MNLYAQIARNKRRSFTLIALLVLLAVGVVYVYGLYSGANAIGLAGVALVITGIYSLVSYYYSDKIVLAIANAKRIEKHDAVELYRLVENLCIGDGLPVPSLYIIEDEAMNAFATGRDPAHAALAFTTGLLGKLDRQELEGVAAHELSHVKNLDTRLTTLVVVLVGALAIIADWIMRSTLFGGLHREDDRKAGGFAGLAVLGLVLAIITPIIAQLIQLAISRQREYLADASAALLTRYPEGLARALEKLGSDHAPLASATNATSSLYIVNPLRGDMATLMSNLFNTHPPIEERIRRLRSM
jgi:heat shock protein HtpX